VNLEHISGAIDDVMLQLLRWRLDVSFSSRCSDHLCVLNCFETMLTHIWNSVALVR
jgi:hypothetical protein